MESGMSQHAQHETPELPEMLAYCAVCRGYFHAPAHSPVAPLGARRDATRPWLCDSCGSGPEEEMDLAEVRTIEQVRASEAAQAERLRAFLYQ
jgi:hypothetical protein